jgi:hypothetical protein
MGVHFEIPSPVHWNLIGCATNAPHPALSPSTILPSPSSHYAFIRTGKNTVRFLKMLAFHF